MQPTIAIAPIGIVESSLRTREQSPRQPDEDAPAAWLVFDASVREALSSLRVGDSMVLLTWLDRAQRDVLSVHPRGEISRPVAGVFSTRSPDRPNPIGLHDVDITAVDGLRVHVRHLDALDGTPILDVKPSLAERVRDR